MNSRSSSPLAVLASIVAVICGILVAVLAPRFSGSGRVLVLAGGIVIALVALFVVGYLLSRSMTRGGS